jgi:hypothetical protein
MHRGQRMRQTLTFTVPVLGALIAFSLVGCSSDTTEANEGAASNSQSTADGCEAAASKLGTLTEKAAKLKDASEAYAEALAAGGDTTAQQQAAADALGEVAALYAGAATSVENADVKTALENLSQAMTEEGEATTDDDLAAAKQEVESSSKTFIDLCGTP